MTAAARPFDRIPAPDARLAAIGEHVAAVTAAGCRVRARRNATARLVVVVRLAAGDGMAVALDIPGPNPVTHPYAVRRTGTLNHGGWQENYERWFVEALKLKGRSVLDVGCARGSIACGFGKTGALVSGCDANEHAIVKGREHWLADHLKIRDATNLHYWKDGTFDFVHSAQVFEHFKPELVPHILAEVNRVTKPDGVLFVCLDTTETFARQGRDLEERRRHPRLRKADGVVG